MPFGGDQNCKSGIEVQKARKARFGFEPFFLSAEDRPSNKAVPSWKAANVVIDICTHRTVDIRTRRRRHMKLANLLALL